MKYSSWKWLSVGVCLALVVTTNGQARSTASLPPAPLQGCSVHIEVDLPPPQWRVRSAAALFELPAELVLEVENESSLARLELCSMHGVPLLMIDNAGTPGLGLNEAAIEYEAASTFELFRKLPPGQYEVRAQTLSGRRLTGSIELDARLPGPFHLLAPTEASVPAGEDLLIAWTPASGAREYEIEVEQEDTGMVYAQRVPARTTSFIVPKSVLEPDRTYDVSLTVRGDNDNELELETSFSTGRSKQPR